MGRYTDMLRKRLRSPLPAEIVTAMRTGTEARAQASRGKGKFDGNCNRTACQKPIRGANWWNSSTRAYYCGECARSINHWSLKDDGIIICSAVTDPTDQPPFPVVLAGERADA